MNVLPRLIGIGRTLCLLIGLAFASVATAQTPLPDPMNHVWIKYNGDFNPTVYPLDVDDVKHCANRLALMQQGFPRHGYFAMPSTYSGLTTFCQVAWVGTPNGVTYYEQNFAATKKCPGAFVGQQCYCPVGAPEAVGIYNGSNDSQVCVVPKVKISLATDSYTKAAPCGPRLVLTAKLTRRGAAVPGESVVFFTKGANDATVGQVDVVADAQGMAKAEFAAPEGSAGTTLAFFARSTNSTNTAQATTKVGACNMCSATGDESGFGNPIAGSSGEKYEQFTDFADTGAHPLGLTRRYSSFKQLDTQLGRGWQHNYAGAMTLVFSDLASGRTVTAVVVELAVGGSYGFERTTVASSGSGTVFGWLSNDTIHTLVQDLDGWTFTRGTDGSQWRFDPTGVKLTQITERNGWVKNLEYSADNRLTRVVNAFGRALMPQYNVAGLISGFILPDGSSSSYTYDAASRLISSRSPAAPTRAYRYTDATGALLQETLDELGNRVAFFAYGQGDSAVSTVKTGGIDSYAITRALQAGPPAAQQTDRLQRVGVITSDWFKVNARITDPLGTLQLRSYQGGNGEIAAVSQAASYGSDSLASRTFGGVLPLTETDFLGIPTAYQWDSLRRLKTSVTRAQGTPQAQTTQTQWHPTMRLPTQIDEPGKRTVMTYDLRGNMLSRIETDTSPTSLSHNSSRVWTWGHSNTGPAQNLPTSLTDPRGQVWSYAYDAFGNRTQTTNPLGHISRATFDGAGRMLTDTASSGLVTTYTFDARGRATQVVSGSNLAAAQQQISNTTYTDFGAVATATQPNGHQTTYTYDAAQRLVGVADNRGNRLTYTLDNMGNRVREELRDPGNMLAWATGRVINSLNRVASQSDALNRNTQFAYDANGEQIATTDPLNNRTSLTLDPLRRLVRTDLPTTESGAAAVNQTYNALDQLASVTDPKNVQTTYTRNAWGEVMAESSPDSGNTSYQRDAAGNITAMTDARGLSRVYTLDALGRATQVAFSGGNVAGVNIPAKVQTFSFDATGQPGQLAGFADSSGSTAYARDPFGRVLTKQQTVADNPSAPTSLSSGYAYNAAGQIAQITYPSGLKVFYRRSATGQIIGIDTQVAGPQTSSTTRPIKPFVSGLTHSALGQPQAWSWQHCGTTPTAQTAATGPCAQASRLYNTDGRMLANEFASYQYDGAGRLSAFNQTLWAQRAITSTASITSTRSVVVSSVVSTASGTASGTATQILSTTTLVNLTNLQPFTTALGYTAAYDARNRLTGFNRADGASAITYAMDANTNRTLSSSRITSDTDSDDDYDDADTRRTLAITSRIDANSNRLLGVVQTLTTQRGTRTFAPITTSATFTLDASGSITSDGTRTFSFDASGDMARVSVGANYRGTATAAAPNGSDKVERRYLTNALGQRVFKSEPTYSGANGTTAPSADILGDDFVAWLKKNFNWLWTTAQTNVTLGDSFVYAEADSGIPSWALLGQYGNGASSNTGRSEIIWLPIESAGGDATAIPIGWSRGNRLYAIHSDHLGTPRRLTDDDNKAVWQWPYSAYGDNKPSGVLKATTNPNAAITNQPELLRATTPIEFNLRFPGQYADSDTGLSYNYFRHYNPQTGRYVQSDPIGLDGGINRFGYVEGNPLSFSDPEGLKTMQCTKPLNVLGPKYGPLGYKYGPMLYHQYSCIVGKDGKVTCGGQDRGENGAGKPSKDIIDPPGGQCKETEPDNQCYEACLVREWAKPRPKYGIPFGTDCQEYDDEVNTICRKQCKAK